MKELATTYCPTVHRITTRLLDQHLSILCTTCNCTPHQHRYTQHILQASKRKEPSTCGDPTKWMRPFLDNKIVTTVADFFLKFITGTTDNNLPSHNTRIRQQFPQNMEDWDTGTHNEQHCVTEDAMR